MKIKLFLLFVFLRGALVAQTPPEKYFTLIKKADTYYRTKNYKNSALTYSQAFKLNHGIAYTKDRLNAACSWALAGIPDSAFYHLNYLAPAGTITDYEQAKSDADLKSLHKDKRWKTFILTFEKSIQEKDAKLDKNLIHQLEEIYSYDQQYRIMYDSILKRSGENSKELKQIRHTLRLNDSFNLYDVSEILDTKGWLGADIIGEQGDQTLFLVIQHADKKTQTKYLPMLREAVKSGNADPSSLAVLEDIIALSDGRKQIYGTQVIQDPVSGKYTLPPIENENEVDKRRASVGLQSLKEYLKPYQISFGKAEIILNNTDMDRAVEIHDSIAGPFNIFNGYGQKCEFKMKPEIATQDNLYLEENSAWFKFTIDRDTTLVFDIVPEFYKDDYDFVLFRCNSVNCAEILKSQSTTPQRLCYSANEAKNGSTGLSISGTQTFLKVGFGDGYTSSIDVKAGDTFYLMVNFSNVYLMTNHLMPKGFTIYFYDYWPKKPEYLKHPAVSKKAMVMENIFFETGKANLLKSSFVSLDKLVSKMKSSTTMKIEIRGHTDNSGDEKLNQQLSQKRAQAVADYIISKGIEKSRVTYIGLGSTKPLADNKTEEGKMKNRRVEFIIVKP